MYSIFIRLNFVLTYTLSILAAITICLAISPLFPQQTIKKVNVNINASNKTVIKNRHYAIVKFDLQADLSGVFNWNIKELFIYLTADYTSNDEIKTVIWDKIALRGHDNYLNLRNQFSDYFLEDVSNVCDKNLTLKLHWNTIPNAGAFYWHTSGESEAHTFPFPSNFCSLHS